MGEVEEFIVADGRRMEVGERGLEIETDFGGESYDDIMPGVPCHDLALWVDPKDDGIPRLVMTGVQLFTGGDSLDVLDGLRLRHSLDTGDYGEFALPWIRPGSTVGVSELIYQSAQDFEADADFDKCPFLAGELMLNMDRVGDRWRVEVAVQHEEAIGQRDEFGFHFHAVFLSDMVVSEAS